MRLAFVAVVFLSVVASASASIVLWDQSAIDTLQPAIVDQEFSDYPAYSAYQMHDIYVDGGGWDVQSVHTYFHGGTGNWAGITQARLTLVADDGSGLPSNSYMTAHGSHGTAVPVTVTNNGGYYEIAATGLTGIQLAPGAYWIGLTPMADFGTYGQQFHSAAASGVVGYESGLRNPGGGFALPFGTVWGGAWSGLGYGAADGAVLVDGEYIPEPASLLLLGLGILIRRR